MGYQKAPISLLLARWTVSTFSVILPSGTAPHPRRRTDTPASGANGQMMLQRYQSYCPGKQSTTCTQPSFPSFPCIRGLLTAHALCIFVPSISVLCLEHSLSFQNARCPRIKAHPRLSPFSFAETSSPLASATISSRQQTSHRSSA